MHHGPLFTVDINDCGYIAPNDVEYKITPVCLFGLIRYQIREYRVKAEAAQRMEREFNQYRKEHKAEMF